MAEQSFEYLHVEGGSPVKMWTRGVPVEDGAKAQLSRAAKMPFIFKHVAAMPDVHVGIGATVGSVIPTKGAVIPAAVGVDIGCGMVAAELDVTEDQLPDTPEAPPPAPRGPRLSRTESAIPAGVGRGHDTVERNADRWLAQHKPATELS